MSTPNPTALSDVDPTTPLDELRDRVAHLKIISEFTKDRYDEARGEIARRLKPGDRLISRSPLDGTRVGAVYMTDPKTECRITDGQALRDWLQDRYPELCESGYEVIGSDKEVIAVLFEHAPHLLRRVQKVSVDALREIRATCVTLGAVVGPGGEADMPGLELHTPDPVVACRPAETGLQAVMDLYRANRLGLDGTLKRLEG